MRGLSSLERVILESIGKQSLPYEEIQMHSGLQENVCFNILQALVIRGLLRVESGRYKINENISPLMMEELNGLEARRAESLEMIEALVEQDSERIFRYQKIAMESRDEKIFIAMLSNLESFLRDAHVKAEKTVAMKDRKVVFWGMGDVQKLMKQVMVGK
jgi:DNA-binding IclR family transcriptional regulator